MKRFRPLLSYRFVAQTATPSRHDRGPHKNQQDSHLQAPSELETRIFNFTIIPSVVKPRSNGCMSRRKPRESAQRNAQKEEVMNRLQKEVWRLIVQYALQKGSRRSRWRSGWEGGREGWREMRSEKYWRAIGKRAGKMPDILERSLRWVLVWWNY